jgi:hypothetical protein
MDNNIYKFLKQTFNPRLSTRDMETSPTRCGCEYRISTMDFGDHKPHFPTLAIGAINTGQGWTIRATWNQYGECTVEKRRIRSFDLVTPAQKEINDAKPVFIFFAAFLLFIIISILG